MPRTTAKNAHKENLVAIALLTAIALAGSDAFAQKTDEEIALAAQNPVAAMISVPLQYNYDQNFGRLEEGHKNFVNVQPVIPFSISDRWNLISRTIVPVIWQQDVVPGTGGQSGMGDITQSFFFSPKEPTSGGWIWGAGPVIYLPTATGDLLGADKWGLGPTAVFLRQEHGWTYGMLANHLWSMGGSGKANISNTYVQPFVTYTTKTHTSFTVNSETTYNWETDKWAVPFNFMVTQMSKVGQQRLQLQAGARYWADSPDVGPHGWGGRLTLTFLFPT